MATKGKKPKAVAATKNGGTAKSYRHPEAEAVMRPEIGTQAQFKKKKEPKKYRYDSSLSPSLEWDGQNPAREQGEAPEIPRYEANRGPGSTAEVDFWTSREPREVVHSHLNYMVPDTKRWEQSGAYYIDNHPATAAFVKNGGLGFSIPYLHNGQMHDYIPDFIIKVKTTPEGHLILETKGFDPLTEVKTHAAERWVAAVNADSTYGKWLYAICRKPEEVAKAITTAVAKVAETGTAQTGR